MTSRTYLDANGSAAFICAPSATEYLAQVRDRGCRKWRTVGSYPHQEQAAQMMLGEFMAKPGLKRGRVVAFFEWYDPSVCFELVR